MGSGCFASKDGKDVDGPPERKMFFESQDPDVDVARPDHTDAKGKGFYYKGGHHRKGDYQEKGKNKGDFNSKGKGRGKYGDYEAFNGKGERAREGLGAQTNEPDAVEDCPLDDAEDDEHAEDAPPEDGIVPPFFAEILRELEKYKDKLGGMKHFKQKPFIEKKVSRRDFSTTYTDYEYVYLTVLGFAFLHSHNQEIITKNNGQMFTRNPGVQMLERICGITMHAGRDGSDGNHLLRSAPALLVEAFQLCRADGRPGSCLHFFTYAFDRTGGPCLEGRVGLLMQYLEKQKRSSDPQTLNAPPWEDVSLQVLAKDASPQDILGEHLRVFVGECTWKWSKMRKIGYDKAKDDRFSDEHSADFAKYFNAANFEETMKARHVATEGCLEQWESSTKSGEWLPYQPDVSDKISLARKQGLPSIRLKLGPKSWNYTVDFSKMVQRNDTTGGERDIRCVDRPNDQRAGRVTLEELKEVIQVFVDLATLPEAPGCSIAVAVSGVLSGEPPVVEECEVVDLSSKKEEPIETIDSIADIYAMKRQASGEVDPSTNSTADLSSTMRGNCGGVDK